MIETRHGGERRRDLDGLRGVAIALTLLLHYVSRGGFIDYAAPRPIALFLDSFWSGVDIFFVLSGFLIGGIILDNSRAPNFFRVFYLRRALRILPVALLAIAFAYLAMPFLGASFPAQGQVPLYAYLLFINNFWTSVGIEPYPPLGPMWSLAIEEQYYLLAPAFMLFTGARVRNAALIALVLGSPFLRLGSSGVSAWDFTLLRLDGLAAGMLVAVLLRETRFAAYCAGNRRNVVAIVFGLVLAALLFSISPRLTVHERISLGVSLNSLATAGVIVLLNAGGKGALSVALSRGWLVALGRWSYFLYLMHIPILMCVATTGAPRWAVPVIAFAACLACAWASWRHVESPLIAIGKRVAYAAS